MNVATLHRLPSPRSLASTPHRGLVEVATILGLYGFYGRPGEGRDGTPGPAQRASELEAPVLALQAGADQNISAEDNAAFDAALTAAGLEHEVVTYDGAPHSFFDRSQQQFAAASEDAWGKVLAFIEHYNSRQDSV